MASSSAIIERVSNNTETSNATPVAITTFGTENDRGYQVWAQIIGISTGSTLGGGYVLAASFKNVGGSLTKVGTLTVIAEHEDDSDWNTDIIQSGTNIQVLVAGDTSQTVDWTSFVQILTTIGIT